LMKVKRNLLGSGRSESPGNRDTLASNRVPNQHCKEVALVAVLQEIVVHGIVSRIYHHHVGPVIVKHPPLPR
jgi:hypothetical protein